MDKESIGKEVFRVQTKMTQEIYEYGSRGFQKYSFQRGGKNVWFFFLAVLAVTGAGMFIAEGMLRRTCIFLFSMSALIFIPVVVMWAMRRFTVGKVYQKVKNKTEGNIDQTYTFYEEAVVIRRWYMEETIKYSYLVFMLELPRMFMVFTRNNIIYYFRKDEITGGTAEELKQFLEEKAEIRAVYVDMKG